MVHRGRARALREAREQFYDEIQAFYDELFPHAEDAVAYIDKFDYSEPLPEDVANLRNLLYSLITVSLAVELWKQPRVKHSAKYHSDEIELTGMGPSSQQLEIVDCTPLIGSETQNGSRHTAQR